MNEAAPPVLLWIRHPPYSTVHLSEGVRLAAMGTALGSTYRVLFIGEGVRALVRGQEAFRLGPPIERMFAGIVTEAQPAFVHLPSLLRRGLDPSSLVSPLPFLPVGDGEAAAALRDAVRVVPL